MSAGVFQNDRPAAIVLGLRFKGQSRPPNISPPTPPNIKYSQYIVIRHILGVCNKGGVLTLGGGDLGSGLWVFRIVHPFVLPPPCS